MCADQYNLQDHLKKIQEIDRHFKDVKLFINFWANK